MLEKQQWNDQASTICIINCELGSSIKPDSKEKAIFDSTIGKILSTILAGD